MPHVRTEIPVPSSREEARDIQRRFASQVRRGEMFRYAAGVDVIYSADGKQAYAVAAVLSTTNWSVIQTQRIKTENTPQHDPEMSGFRTGPLIIGVLEKLVLEPDVIVVNGHGTAHPSQFGVACHVGLSLDLPTVGVSKRWPSGCRKPSVTLPKKRGSKTALLHEVSGGAVGFEVYAQDNSDPLYVSTGHRLSVEDAVSIALRCSPWFSEPEPLRQARKLSEAFREEDTK